MNWNTDRAIERIVFVIIQNTVSVSSCYNVYGCHTIFINISSLDNKQAITPLSAYAQMLTYYRSTTSNVIF